MPPKTAEICPHKSVEFEELAKQLGNPGWAEQFWKLAEQWRQLADQIECYDLEKINPKSAGGLEWNFPGRAIISPELDG